MHYGNGAYLGVVSRGDRPGHGAFLVHRRFFAGLEALKRKFSSEFGVELAGEPKGSAAIDYSHYSPGLAVGDAKMATHPFLGFGMKHAILSARLLAELIARGSEASYPGLHAGLFRRIRLASLFGGRLYDSPFRRLLQLPTAFSGICYRWIHGGWSWPTGRRNTRMSGSV